MNEEKDPKIIINLKTWFKKTSKITISFLMISFILGTTGLILGATSYHKTNGYQSYLGHDYTVYWGGTGTTIWETKNLYDETKIDLYFSIKPIFDNDIKWNGIYPNGYFDN